MMFPRIRLLFLPSLILMFLSLYVLAASNQSTVQLLQGQWQGTIDVSYDLTGNRCEHHKHAYHLALNLTIGGVNNPQAQLFDKHCHLLASGILTINKLVPEILPACISEGYTAPKVALNIPSASVQAFGVVDGNTIRFNEWEGAPKEPYTLTYKGIDTPWTEGYEFSPIQLQGVTADSFSIVRPSDISNNIPFTVSGSFKRIGAAPKGEKDEPHPTTIPKGLFVGLLAYLCILLTGLLIDPSSSKLIAGAGGLVGMAEALGGLGLKTIAAQGRLGGFAGAALAEAISLAQTYQSSTAAGESGIETTGKLAVSFGVDIAEFAAGIVLMDAAIGVVATAAGTVGTAGAIVAGIGGAGVIMYGIAQGGDFIKSWGTNIVSSFFK